MGQEYKKKKFQKSEKREWLKRMKRVGSSQRVSSSSSSSEMDAAKKGEYKDNEVAVENEVKDAADDNKKCDEVDKTEMYEDVSMENVEQVINETILNMGEEEELIKRATEATTEADVPITTAPIRTAPVSTAEVSIDAPASTEHTVTTGMTQEELELAAKLAELAEIKRAKEAKAEKQKKWLKKSKEEEQLQPTSQNLKVLR